MNDIFPLKPKSVLIIGLGQLGLPVAKYVKSKGFDVYGYDIREEAMQVANQIHGIKISNNFRNFDIYIVCISTHNRDDIYLPQVDDLLSIIKKISYEAS
ncbi:MAG: NAD(P)-dependent oxidoreductase, partial [Nitrososphaeraceae archaeon]|nr:NAD(P)-dependent oxidoreductase [Nitrososphaeraceae archaeon]